MSKELILVLGLPHSGRTTWINKKYPSESYILVDENQCPNLYKNGKIDENNLFNSINWVQTQVKENMEKSSEKIVVCLLQNKPNRWRGFLGDAILFGYKFTAITPTNGYLYFYNNKTARNIEQIDWMRKSTVSRFPKIVLEKKNQDDDEQPKEFPSVFGNLENEFLAGYAFVMQNKLTFGSEPNKWLESIENIFKTVIIKEEQLKKQLENKVQKEAEKKARDTEKQGNVIQVEQAEQVEQVEQV